MRQDVINQECNKPGCNVVCDCVFGLAAALPTLVYKASVQPTSVVLLALCLDSLLSSSLPNLSHQTAGELQVSSAPAPMLPRSWSPELLMNDDEVAAAAAKVEMQERQRGHRTRHRSGSGHTPVVLYISPQRVEKWSQGTTILIS